VVHLNLIGAHVERQRVAQILHLLIRELVALAVDKLAEPAEFDVVGAAVLLNHRHHDMAVVAHQLPDSETGHPAGSGDTHRRA